MHDFSADMSTFVVEIPDKDCGIVPASPYEATHVVEVGLFMQSLITFTEESNDETDAGKEPDVEYVDVHAVEAGSFIQDFIVVRSNEVDEILAGKLSGPLKLPIQKRYNLISIYHNFKHAGLEPYNCTHG